MIGPKQLEEVIRGSESLGALSATAVWALWAVLMVAYIIWREKRLAGLEKERIAASLAAAESRLISAQALDKLTDKVARIEIILSERTSPRRD